MSLRAIPQLAASALLVACTFSSEGRPGPLELGDQPDQEGEAPQLNDPLGEPADDDGAVGDDGADGGGEADGGAADSAGDAGEDDGTPGDDDSSADDSAEDDAGDDAGDDGGEPDPPAVDCSAPFELLLWAEDAALTPPMVLGVASSATGSPSIAYSTVAESGSITFEVMLPCAGEYSIHGLVWDLTPGAWGDPDADSLYVDLGGGEEVVWRYGCQTTGLSQALSWQPLAALQGQPCDASTFAVSASAPGTYALTFRNREAGGGSAVAAIAALAMSNDADFDPNDTYEPY